MGIVVLAEYEVSQMVLIIDNRQRIELVVPDDVIAFGQCVAC